MTTAVSTGDLDEFRRPLDRLVPLRVKVVLAVLGIAVFGFVCYGIGTDRGSAPHTLTGRATVGGDQASVEVDGWFYGIAISPNGMTWYDAGGASHEGGIPPCLRHPGSAWIRFGYANATGLDGTSSSRVVTWTQCVSQVG